MFQLSRKKIIIGISIWIVAIALTISLTLLANKDNKESVKEQPKVKEEEKKEEVKKNPYKVTVYDTYDINDLEVYQYEVNEDFSYCQIKYLKDNKLQKKINEVLHDKSTNLYNKVKTYKNVYFESYAEFNANGLLSIHMYARGTDKKGKEYEYLDSLNINLLTGEELELKDLFYDEQQMYTSYARAAAEIIASDNGASEDEKLKPNKVANMEDKIFKYINEIKKGNYIFSFSYDAIDIYVENFSVSIYVSEDIDNTVYFKKYIPTTDLFTGEYKGRKDVYIFSMTPSDEDYYNVKEINDHLFLDTHMLFYDLRKISDKDSLIKNSKVEEYINKLIKSADKNKYTLISGTGEVTYIEDYKIYYLNSSFNVCSSNIKNKNYMLDEMSFSKTIITGAFDNLVYFEDKKVQCKEYYYVASVDVKNNRLLTLDNLFKEGYDYKTVLKEKFVNYCVEFDGLTNEQAEQIWNSNKLKIIFRGDSIDAEYDDEIYVSLSLDDIDRSYLTI